MEVIAKKETDPTEAEVAIEEAAAEEGTEEVPTKGRTNQISRSIHNKRNVNSHSSNTMSTNLKVTKRLNQPLLDSSSSQ